MPFHYPFQRILDIREKEKEQLQISLAAALRKVEEEQAFYEDLLQRKEKLQTTLMAEQRERVEAARLLQLYSYQQRLEEMLAARRRSLMHARQEADRKMEQVAAKAKEAKMWSVLKSKALGDYRYWENRREQDSLDEIAASIHTRAHR